MAYMTIAEARNAAQSAYQTKTMAREAIRKSALSPMSARFHVFLSHSKQDEELIAGVARLIQDEGLRVYVDWIQDPFLDRTKVTAQTAETLRTRMDHCEMLLYAWTPNSVDSKWMPWELGYFDGRSSGRVGILPVMNRSFDSFPGQEYLGVYPTYEWLNFTGYGRRLGEDLGPSTARLLASVAR